MHSKANPNTQEVSERTLWLGHLEECKRVLNATTITELAEKLDYRRQEIERFIHGDELELPADALRAKIMWSLRETDAVSSETRRFLSSLLLWGKSKSPQQMREYWLAKIAFIADKYKLASDAQVAIFLGISRQALSKFKTGASQLPSLGTQAQIINLEAMTTITDEIWDLFPTKQAQKLKEANKRSTEYFRKKNRAKN